MKQSSAYKYVHGAAAMADRDEIVRQRNAAIRADAPPAICNAGDLFAGLQIASDSDIKELCYYIGRLGHNNADLNRLLNRLEGRDKYSRAGGCTPDGLRCANLDDIKLIAPLIRDAEPLLPNLRAIVYEIQLAPARYADELKQAQAAA